MADPLAGVRVKVARARHHLDELRHIDREVELFCKAHLRLEMDPDDPTSGRYILDEIPAVPNDFPAVAGDVVHNLRSALDHLAHQLVLAQGAQPTEKTVFPILKQRRANGELPTIHPGVGESVQQLLDTVQPYNGNVPQIRPLWAVHRLDIADKHRQLISTVVASTGAGWMGEADVFDFNLGPFEPGDAVCHIRLPQPGYDPTVMVHFGVSFREPEVRGMAMTTAAPFFLERVTEEVVDTIRQFSTFIPDAVL